MNKKLWGVIIVFLLAGFYGLARLVFYNPIESITKAKLDLTQSQPNINNATKPDLPSQGPPLPPSTDQPQTLTPNTPSQLPGPRLDALPSAQTPQTQSNLPQQPPPSNQGALTGKWQNNADSKYTVQFKADNTVTEYLNGKQTGSGTWKFEDANNQSLGLKVKTLQVIINNETRSYQILNLSATNLSYVTSSQEGIQSYKRLP